MWNKHFAIATIISILAIEGCNTHSHRSVSEPPSSTTTEEAPAQPMPQPVSVDQQEAEVIQSVNAEQFEQLIEQWVEEGAVIDVRTPEEYLQGHLPHALNINIYDENFKEQVLRHVGERPVVLVYCRSGRRSLKAAHILKEMGYQKIYNLRGGILEWMESGRPVLE